MIRTAVTATLLASLVLGPAAVARAQSPAPAAPTPPPAGVVDAPPPVPAPPPPLMAAPPPPPPPVAMLAEPPMSPTRSSKVPAYILWGVAGASLIAGASFGFAALSAKSDFDKNPTVEKADTVHDRAVMSDVGIGLGAILAVTGTIIFCTDSPAETSNHASGQPRDKNSMARLHLLPLISPNAGGGVVSMRF